MAGDHLRMNSVDQVSNILKRKKKLNPFETQPDVPATNGKPRLKRTLWQELWRWAVVLTLFMMFAVGLLGVSMFVAIYRDLQAAT